jgi:hypothetical protein
MLKPPLMIMSLLAVHQRQEAVFVEAADVAGADEALALGVEPLGLAVFSGWLW